ncbi:LPP20 family lipoprotein [Halobacteriovorax sp.]|uniref:LPP20 family lipoprotein n=1 Tax=Halobacteriovorax sp. TaxID=2020862 RepID=UPI00356515DF
MYKVISLIFLIQMNIYAQPIWISSPYEFCPPTEICAVGEATGALAAEAAARDSLAKVFSVNVKSSQSVITTSKSTTEEDVVKGSVSEETYSEIVEFTDEVLEGSYIKERYESDESHFALIALNKTKTSGIFEDRMKGIDTEVKALVKDGRRSSLNKSIKKLKLRASIHDKYRILKGSKYLSSVSMAEILRLKKIKRELGTKVSLNVREISNTKEVMKSIKFNLVENDFIVTRDNADFKIEVSLKQEPQYIKVKGFVKYKFILNIRSLNKDENEIGSLKYEIIQTGRSQEQSYENALPGINNFIYEKFNELNID